MNQHAVVSKFSHVKPTDTEFKGGGLRDFFLYRDLGIADATSGQVICHLVKANPDLPPEEGTGWHKHLCDFQIVIMTKGWARFMTYDVKLDPKLAAYASTIMTMPEMQEWIEAAKAEPADIEELEVEY